METITVVVPKAFWIDHESRDCIIHPEVTRVIKNLSRGVRVEFHPEDLADLYSDACYYGTDPQDFGRDMFGICMSARATKQMLERDYGFEQPRRTSMLINTSL